MSARSMRRARERQLAKDQRRSERLGRHSKAALGAGAALGATVLFAPSAQAETFTVTALSPDDGTTEGTLRKEMDDAANDPGFDIVNFQPGLSGTITLNGTQLDLAEDTEIRGPGRDVITVSGADQSRVFYVGNNEHTLPSIISGLTIADGNSGDSQGGGIAVNDAALRVEDVAITGNAAPQGDGGGIASNKYSILQVVDSTISGNTAGDEQVGRAGGGIFVDQDVTCCISKYGPTLIQNTTISGNTASESGGGIFFDDLYGSGARVVDSTISGNDAGRDGGGISLYDVGNGAELTVENTRITGNDAESGGGLNFGGRDSTQNGSVAIEDSTISGNHASAVADAGSNGDGGGVNLRLLNDAQFRTEGTTISGNTASDDGGGIYVDESYGTLRVNRTTISGNSAAGQGGGAYVYSVYRDNGESQYGSLHFNDSTIASNQAAAGGGIFSYGDPILLHNTIAADNSNGDLAEAEVVVAQTFLLDFSLIENVDPSASTEEKTVGSNIIGQDPQLGPLTDNGGPTETQLPAITSPAIDRGSSNRIVDQRRSPRPFDQPGIGQPDLPGADASDIGAVELQAQPPQPQGSCNGEAATVVLAPEGETTFGTDGRDVIVGNADQNAIRGRGGNDLICGFGGRDLLGGGPGDDEILGQGGNDNMVGDQDDDTMRGGDGNDKVSGTTGDDRMFGQGGRDRLTGAAGDDLGSGGPQDDVLIGGSGDDDLRGGAGKDRLNGGKGLDQLNGGAGSDQEIQKRR